MTTTAGSKGGSVKGTSLYPLRILTQARFNPVRKEILDMLRSDPRMGSEKGTRFVVRWLAVQNPWAMFQGETEGRLTPVEALLRRVDGEWVVIDLQKTNGRKIKPADYPSAPPAVFGPAGFSLAPRDSLLILTNARGDPTRSAILDALRREFGISNKFVVRWMRAKGGYAYVIAEVYPYQLPFDAILKKRSWGWEVLLAQGEGDFEKSIPLQYAGVAPRSIFP